MDSIFIAVGVGIFLHWVVGRSRFVVGWNLCMVGWSRFVVGLSRFVVGWIRCMVAWIWFVVCWGRGMVAWSRCVVDRGIVSLTKVDQSKESSEPLHVAWVAVLAAVRGGALRLLYSSILV